MRKSAKRNLKKLLQKTGIIVFVFLIIASSPADYGNSNNSFSNHNNDDGAYDFILPNTQAPLEDSNLNTGAINVTISQRYSNTSDIGLTSDSNSFTAPVPSASGYSSSLINISVKDIAIQNHTLEIEDIDDDDHGIGESAPAITSFVVPTSSYLTNASFNLRYTGTVPQNVSVVLYNTTWDTQNSRVFPDSNYVPYKNLGNLTVDIGFGWKTVVFDNLAETYLNNSETYGNTWFIGLYDGLYGSTPSFLGEWRYSIDAFDVDESESYYWAITNWSLVEDNGPVDFNARVGLSLNTATPDPSDINLSINGTAVEDTTSNKGEWIETNPHSGSNGKLNFTISADWYDFSLDIDEVNIDYIKSSFDELTEYIVDINQLVYWNGSVNITEFDSQFSNNEINFTIPYDWTVTDLLNESTSISYSTTSSQPTKTIQVTGADATNGKWKLVANSANYGYSIGSYIEGSLISFANYSDDVSFRVVFDGAISGDINLSVFDPSQNMKYTYENSSVSNEQTIYFPSYDLSENVTEYGIYSIQSKWMNTTHIGYWEQNFTVIADTDLTLQSPSQDTIYNPTDTFTIALYFEDTGQPNPIDGATIYYDIDGGGQQTVLTNNGTSGYYEIDVDCNIISGNGDKTVEIASNKTNYNNQTLEYNFYINAAPYILNEATLQGDSRWLQDEDFVSFTIDLTGYENDTEDSGVDLDWYVTDLDTSLVTVSGEYSDTDVLTFYSEQDEYGFDTFTLWSVDTGGLTDSVSITINVKPVNDNPEIQTPGVIQGDSRWLQNEDFGSFIFDFSPYESDEENTTTYLDWYITGLDTSLVTVLGENSDNDELTFSSVLNAWGNDQFTLNLIDGGGLTDSILITITVKPVNDDPIILTPGVIQGNSTWLQNEDFGSFIFDFSPYESDEENTTTYLDWYITGLDTSLVTVLGENSDNDELTFSSVLNAWGNDQFTLNLIDGGGLTDSILITITVKPVNDDPIILTPGVIQGNSTWLQNEDFGSFIFDFSPYESDEENTTTYLDWYITGLDTSLVTVLGENSDNDELTFSSVLNAWGNDQFTLNLIDGGGLTDSILITITVKPVNDDPIILTPGVIQGNSTWLQNEDFGSFIFDFSPYESDEENTTTYLDWYITGLDTSLVTVLGENSDNDELTFSSVLNAWGNDQFTLNLIDGGGLTDSILITITVKPVNDDPIILTPGVIQGNSTWLQNEDFGSFIFDFSPYESDEENTTTYLDWYITGLDTSLVTVLGENSDNDELTFSSVLNAWGNDQFTLNLIDGGGLTDSILITITVKPVNDDPIILTPGVIQGNSTWLQNEDFGSFIFDFSPYESDEENTTTYLDWYITGLDTSLVTYSGEYSDSDVITFQSVVNASGIDTFTVWLIDSDGLTDSVDITIQVTDVNDKPWITQKSIIINNDSWDQWENFANFYFYLNEYENDIESSGTDLTWSIDSGYSLFQLVNYETTTDIMTIGSLSNVVGYESFILRLTDAGGLSDTVEVYINVTGKFDASITSLNNNSNYFNDEQFDIQVYVYGSTRSAVINDATISYSIMGASYSSDNINNLNNGYYNITIFGWDETSLGQIDIDIRVEKNYFITNYTSFTYLRYIRTTQSLNPSEFYVIKGDNVTISPYFLDNESVGLTGGSLDWDTSNAAFLNSWEYVSGGLYELELDSTPVSGSSSAYTINFNISRQWYLTQQYSVDIYVINRTSLTIVSFTQSLYGHTDFGPTYELYYGADVTITIQYLDTDNLLAPINGAFANLTYGGTTYYDTTNSTGHATFTIPTAAESIGIGYSIPMIGVNATLLETQTTSTTFNILQCPTYSTNLEIQQYGEVLSTLGGDYQAWHSDDLEIQVEFRNSFTDALIIQGTGTLTYLIAYQDTDTDANGLYEWSVDFDTTVVGNDYAFVVSLVKSNYQTEILNFEVDVSAVPTYLTVTSVVIDTTTLTYNGGTDTYSGEYYGTDIFIDIEWRNEKDDSLITSVSTGQIDFNSINYNYDSEVGGTYSWQLDYLDSIAGNNTIDVTFTKANYVSGTDSFGIDITSGLTNLYIWAVYNGNWNSSDTAGVYPTYQVYDTYVYVRYFDTNNKYWIDGTNGNASLAIGGTTYYNTSGTADGYFMFTLPASTYSGTPSITINSNHTNYNNGNGNFQLDYIDISTLIVNGTYYNSNGPLGYNTPTNTYSAKSGSNIIIIAWYEDSIHNLNISGASVTFISTEEGTLLNTTNSNGLTTITLDHTQYASDQTYYFTLSITKTDYETYDIDFYISFITWETGSSLTRINQTDGGNITPTGITYDILRNFSTTITAYYEYTHNSTGIIGADATLWYDSSGYDTTTNSSGYATWTISTASATVGVYVCYIDFSKLDHQGQHIDFNLNLSLIQTSGVLQDVLQPDHPGHGTNTLPYVLYSYQGFMSYNLSVEATYFDETFSQNINDATATLMFDGTPYVDSTGISGVYSWSDIPVFDKTGQYTITITIAKSNWETVNLEFNITIQPLPTETLDFDITQSTHTGNTLPYNGSPDYYYVAYTEYGIQIVLKYRDTNNSAWINSANGTLTFDGQDYTDLTGTLGEYSWTISESQLTLGTYLITISMESPYFVSQNYAFNISLNNLPTGTNNFNIQQLDHGIYGEDRLVDQGLPDGYFAYVHYGFTVNLSYVDINNTLNILGATTTQLNFRGSDYGSDFYGGGSYGWTIGQGYVALGTYEVQITFNLDDYAIATYSFNISFYELPTSGLLNSVIQPDHGVFDNLTQGGTPDFAFLAFNAYDTEVSIYFRDTNNSQYLSSATTTLTFNGGTYFIDSEIGGNYTWTIPTMSVAIGTYLVSVSFTLTDYESASIDLNLTLQVLPTSLTFTSLTQTDHTPNQLPIQGSHYIVYTRYGLQIFYEYYDTENSVGIENADVHRLTFDGSTIDSISSTNGIFEWLIDESYMNSEGIYTISIDLQKVHYENHTDSFTINATFLPTDYIFDDILQPDHPGHASDTLVYMIADDSYHGYIAYDVHVYASFFDTNNSMGITGATRTLTYNGIQATWADLNNGHYSFVFDSNDLIEGARVAMNVDFSLQDYESVSFSFYLIVENLPTNYTEISIYHQIPDYDGNLTREGDFLTAYKLFNNITFEFGYWDTNNSIFLSSATTASLYINGTYNSEAVVDIPANTYRWVLDLDPIDFGYFYARFEFMLDDHQSQIFTYNISLEKLTGSAEFGSVQQFGEDAEEIVVESWYLLYSGSNCIINYTFRETTYDIAAAQTSVNLSILGTNLWYISETDENGTVIWNVPVNLAQGDYTFRAELNPDEFNPFYVDLAITTEFRETIYSGLTIQDYGHILSKDNLNFEFAYVDNDLEILVDFIDNYTISDITDGTVRLNLGGTSFYGTYTAGHYEILVPESYIVTPLLNFDLFLNQTYFKNTSESFTVDVLNKNEIRITPLENLPLDLTAGTGVTYSFTIEYSIDGSSEWNPLEGAQINLQFGALNLNETTNSAGIVTFTFTVPESVESQQLQVIFSETYDSEAQTLEHTFSISPQSTNWVPYAGGGAAAFLVIFSTLVIATRKKRRRKRMLKDVDKKIKDKEITKEDESFEEMLEEEKEEIEETSEEQSEAEEYKEEQEQEKEEVQEKEEKEKETEDKEEEESEKEIVEETEQQKEFSLNPEDPLEENIEKMFLRQITEEVIRSKNDLWKKVQKNLKERKIDTKAKQIHEIFEKLQKEKKIRFDSKTKPVGWKLKK